MSQQPAPVSTDSRQKVKTLQSKFVQSADKSLNKHSAQLQKVLIDTIIASPNSQHFKQKLKSLTYLQQNSNEMWQFISNQLQQCINRQYNYQGIEGYNKCFIMFQKIVNWETKGKLYQDDHVKRGIYQSIQSKYYNQKRQELRDLQKQLLERQKL